ncbi:MAG: class I SAM-dependent methyltransferase [Chloroflexota bacterium]|jgi:SAM-dependent methyltransferase|nr:class I SAM-dependent methyltransferase [Chloroflexota bacterium]
MSTAAPQSAADTSNYIKHTHSNPIQRKLIDRFHGVLLKKIEELHPTSFLDAGCGEGFVADLIMQRVPDVRLTGFDFNPASVEMAKTMNPTADFVVASIFEIPFGARQFDVTGCFEVLEHQTDPAGALRELARVTDRALILSVPHEPYFCLANVARGKNLDIRPRGSDPDHKQFWTRAKFGEFITTTCPEFSIHWLGGSLPWTICVATRR